MNEMYKSENFALPMRIEKAIKTLFKRLQQADSDHEGIGKKSYRVPRLYVRKTPYIFADNISFKFLKANIYKPSSISVISAKNDLAIPLCLMLILKYIRGIQRFEGNRKSLLVSLTHPLDIAERLISKEMGYSINKMLGGQIIHDRDWPRLVRAATNVFALEIELWVKGALFEPDQLRQIIDSSKSSTPFGLIVINDSTGQLENDSYCEIEAASKLRECRSIVSHTDISLLVIQSFLPQLILETVAFDFYVKLRDNMDQFELYISDSQEGAVGDLALVMSQDCGIFEENVCMNTVSIGWY